MNTRHETIYIIFIYTYNILQVKLCTHVHTLNYVHMYIYIYIE